MAEKQFSYPSEETCLRLTGLLLKNMKRKAKTLRKLLDDVNDHWGYEDGLYRFYHQSLKVYYLQQNTEQIVAVLAKIAPERQPFCDFFQAILRAGTERKFKLEDNQHWVERAAPIVQAFLHARYFLEMAVKYSAELKEPPQTLPSGWASLLELYGIR